MGKTALICMTACEQYGSPLFQLVPYLRARQPDFLSNLLRHIESPAICELLIEMSHQDNNQQHTVAQVGLVYTPFLPELGIFQVCAVTPATICLFPNAECVQLSDSEALLSTLYAVGIISTPSSSSCRLSASIRHADDPTLLWHRLCEIATRSEQTT